MPEPPFHILVVCTANICRSVMAEQVLRQKILDRGLPVEVSSCGLLFDGRPATDLVRAVLGERGLDGFDHSSRICTETLVEKSDLIVTMERRHIQAICGDATTPSARMHTLGGLVGWLAENAAPGTAPEELIDRCAAERPPSALLGSGRDEVEDPHGRSKRVHRKAADQIDELCRGLLDGLFGPEATAPR